MAEAKKSLADFVKSLTDTGKKKDLAIQGFLEDNGTFKENERIVLVIPTTKQVVRVVVTKVSAEQNNLTGKADIAYTFNDGSMIFETSLQKDGYDWEYQDAMEAEGVQDDAETLAGTPAE